MLRTAQVVENSACSPRGTARRTLVLVAGWITVVGWVLPMSPLTAVFLRAWRALLVLWAPAAVIAANAPYATGATRAGRGHVCLSVTRQMPTVLMTRRPRGIAFLLAGVVLASPGPFVGD